MLGKIEYYFSKLLKKARLRSILSSTVDKSSSIASGTVFIMSSMEKYSFCGYDCSVINTNIGSFCSIANNCEIGGSTHTIDWISTSPVFNENKDQVKKKYAYHKFNPQGNKTEIGNDVWIGAKALVKAGIKVGTGAVIGMGSVVTKDIPPYEIWAGNPAKKIGQRFEDVTIERMLKSKWWQLDDASLQQVAQYANNPEKFLKELEIL